MNKKMLFVAAALAVTTCLAGAVQANALYNSSFEVSDPLQWAAPDRGGGFAQVSTEQAHTGASSMKIWGATGPAYENSIKQDKATAGVAAMSLNPALSYTRSVWVYVTEVPATGEGIEVKFMTGLDAGYFGKSFRVTKANEWVQVADPTLFTGYSNLGMFGIRAYSPNASIYFDDAAFEAVPEPSSIAGLLAGGLGMLGFAIRRRF